MFVLSQWFRGYLEWPLRLEKSTQVLESQLHVASYSLLQLLHELHCFCMEGLTDLSLEGGWDFLTFFERGNPVQPPDSGSAPGTLTPFQHETYFLSQVAAEGCHHFVYRLWSQFHTSGGSPGMKLWGSWANSLFHFSLFTNNSSGLLWLANCFFQFLAKLDR